MSRVARPLYALSAAFVTLYAGALTLSPVVRARAWEVPLRWDHWLGWLAWLSVFALIAWAFHRTLPDGDPYLLPVVSLLTGWGLLTQWRLSEYAGLRQTVWLILTGVIFTLGLRSLRGLGFLQRYKYVWLTSGLLLTALTFFFGANPQGDGLRLWLGCCGIYFQPSEPLKLLLIAYLAAYLAEPGKLSALARSGAGWRARLGVLIPSLVMTGVALLLMVGQRDLGTASILLFLYAAIVYVATGRRLVLVFCLAAIALAALLGYGLFDVVRLRVEAWLNPWADPLGRSFQIVQALLSVASGGVVGRGPGLGSPGLVPVAASDFIFSAIAEESGLPGALALIGLLAVITARGLQTALHAPDTYRRLLAAGLTAYLTAQSVLIIGGNLRLLPLTGVTLPFVSYGGSSLLVSFVALLLLVKISARRETRPLNVPSARAYLELGGFLFLGLAAAAALTGWWAVARAPDLLARPDNFRLPIADRFVRRGALLDRRNRPLAQSIGAPGKLTRQYLYPALGPVLGYSHPIYGLAGLEASQDAYLRGLRGLPGSTIEWQYLLYGQPPPGLDVRLSLDLDLQQTADSLLGERPGALVLLNAASGEILALASHPTFDANQLDRDWEILRQDGRAPLVNRALDGAYPIPVAGGAALPAGGAALPQEIFTLEGMPVETISPLELALNASALSHEGQRPAAILALAVHSPTVGWVLLSPGAAPPAWIDPAAARAAAENLRLSDQPFWQALLAAWAESGAHQAWFLGGTLPDWQGVPLAAVVILDTGDLSAAERIGQGLLQAAIQP